MNECKVIEPKVFSDKRGYFYESYNKKRYKEKYGIEVSFVQDNESYSKKNVLRGLHYQLPPFAQAKLIRVIEGRVLDIAVDIRPGSQSFGDYFSEVLSGENKKQFFIPRGFAHGFVVLSDEARFCYKCDNLYNPEYERGIKWDDPKLGIDWHVPLDQVIISHKDELLPLLKEAELPEA
jgi:dTDP-4-dehydrorhamnose 3,5-epimerase